MALVFRFLGGLVVIPAACLLAGCSRLPDATYTLRSAAEKLDLPEQQARQIAAYLAMFHGTPANPRMADVDEAAELLINLFWRGLKGAGSG